MILVEFCGNGIHATEFNTNVTNLRSETCCVINLLLNSPTEEFLRVTVFLMAKNLSEISTGIIEGS
jgi:hypothetical protein